MALVSPGVEVSIIDQSQYAPAPSNSVPLFLLATAENKANAANTGIAAGTLKSNANKLYTVTSQRDLTTLFGNPFFYKTTNGTPIQGYELNEYGLLSAYSALGVTNRAYVLRADVDLAALVGQVGRPSGDPSDGTYWLDTTNSQWGIFQFNMVTGEFVQQSPIVITDSAYLTGGVPIQALGNIGDYAVNAIAIADGPIDQQQVFYKNSSNDWVALGSCGPNSWSDSIPTVVGSTTYSITSAGSTEFTIDVNGQYTHTVTLGSNSDVDDCVSAINALGDTYLRAENRSGRVVIFYSEPGEENYIVLHDTVIPVGGEGALVSFGLVEADPLDDSTTYYRPEVVFGSSAQMPLWTSNQSKPHPSGSVWMKVGTAGNGANIVLSRFNATAGSYQSVTVSNYNSDEAALAGLDSTGGKSIPANTVYAQYGIDGVTPAYPTYLWKRLVTGPTVITGTVANPTFVNGTVLTVRVSVPGTPELSSEYSVNIVGTNNVAFVTAWSAASIPFTTATITSTGAVQLTHTAGGTIHLYDFVNGVSNGIIAAGGFDYTSNTGSKIGPVYTYTNTAATQASVDPVGGSGATFNISAVGTTYYINGIASVGTSYSVGDEITISGSSLGGSGANDLVLKVMEVTGGAVSKVAFLSGIAATKYVTLLSNWVPFDYTSNEGAPLINPSNGTPWYFSVTNQVDIMVNVAGAWKGYKNVGYDFNGHPSNSIVNATDPNGPIVSASEPTTQSDGTNLSYGDLWIDTSDLENYPVIKRYQNIDGVDGWKLLDNSDQITNNGIVFQDARWGLNGTTDPISDPLPPIASLLTSNYLDIDAPVATNYPQGMLLFNTRRSGYNVKEFRTNYFNAKAFPGLGLPTIKDCWVTISGNMTNGAPYMGRKAQRAIVVQAIKAAVATNMSIREEDTFLNLIACPGYPELQPDMVELNNSRNQTAYIVGDTPLRLPDQATDITNWATNVEGATSTGEEGLVTRSEYMGIYYPSGITTDLTGAEVTVPSSHMMVRTFLRNDQIAYPWFAAAGTRRGTIDNANNIGYIDSVSGEFITIKNRVGIRDTLYVNQINPLAFFTGVGLLNYGNKNSKDTQSALDRTNVARLVAYVRERLQVIMRPFIFEPNDSLTRQQVTSVIQSFFVDLVAKRALYDYSVVCDESNNTPARIDKNELWVDIAIEPIKTIEFIYIPVRILNTGAISGQ